MTVALTYDDTLSRVQVAATALDVTAATATVERSSDQITWNTVRGATTLAVTGQAASVDDYEFSPDVPNYYRVTAYDVSEVQTDQETANITPTLTQVWIKSIARPFLNRVVDVRDFSPVSRPSRAGVFNIVSRSLPVAVTDVRGSRRWTLDLRAADRDEARQLDLVAASGDILLIQAPTTGLLAAVPTGYVAVGDTTETTLPTSDLALRVASWQCIEVAAPGPDVVGTTVTWQGVINAYATWADVIADQATWADLLTLIGDPSDVIVP